MVAKLLLQTAMLLQVVLTLLNIKGLCPFFPLSITHTHDQKTTIKKHLLCYAQVCKSGRMNTISA